MKTTLHNKKMIRPQNLLAFLLILLFGMAAICSSCQNKQNATNDLELDSIDYQDTIIYSTTEYGIVNYHCVYPKQNTTTTHDSIMLWICQQFGDEEGRYIGDVRSLLTKRANDFMGEGDLSLSMSDLTDEADYYMEAINLSVADEDSVSITLCYESYTTQRGLHIYPNYNVSTFSKRYGHRKPQAVHHVQE